jgi:lactoylglutathione lyase
VEPHTADSGPNGGRYGGSVFNDAFPIISTPDMERALAFYRDLLGGKVEYRFPPEGEPGYVGMSIGSAHLGIGLAPEAQAGAVGQRFALWVYADSCNEAVERLRAGGATVTEEPADQPWGERVARVLDPDGNEVIVGQKA